MCAKCCYDPLGRKSTGCVHFILHDNRIPGELPNQSARVQKIEGCSPKKSAWTGICPVEKAATNYRRMM